MKNLKWTAKELFESFESEINVDEFKELYKALIAREIGLDNYTETADELMDSVLENGYYDNCDITSFINEELVTFAHTSFKDAGFDVDYWY